MPKPRDGHGLRSAHGQIQTPYSYRVTDSQGCTRDFVNVRFLVTDDGELVIFGQGTEDHVDEEEILALFAHAGWQSILLLGSSGVPAHVN